MTTTVRWGRRGSPGSRSEDDSLLRRIDKLNIWRRGAERAPHKPLLLLLALGRLVRGESSLPFAECDKRLSDLLREFGPSRQSVHPEYPFWRLQRDGLWQVSAQRPMTLRKGNTDPLKGELREAGAIGSFPDEIQRRFETDPALVAEVAQRVLSAHFPESLHQDILDEVGLSLDFEPRGVRRLRDPSFRKRILTAYSFRCALCDLDLRMSNMTIAIEAAHIKWHQAGGPDLEVNGVALCTLHHKVFDLGAFTIHTDLRVLVSELLNGGGKLEDVLLRHHGQYIRRPLRDEHSPAKEYLEWHRHEVFKESARPLATAG